MQEYVSIQSVRVIASNVYQLSFLSPAIAHQAVPGQFVNVRVENSLVPLLRRPFSIFSVDHEIVSIIFNVVGLGTKLLSQKKQGESLDVLGPLGGGFFPLNDEGYETAVIVAGGLGIAAFPFLTSKLPQSKKIISFVGARTSQQLVTEGLKNLQIATDDGSEGFRGTVVSLLGQYIGERTIDRPRIFSCGPTAMMRSLAKFAEDKNIPCYAALEGDMACGIGLCQGCPVETRNGQKKYSLVCKDGPVFETRTVIF